MKNHRQSVILELIAREPLKTQRQLQEALAQRGIFCTQSTLSRDIRELQLVKLRREDGDVQLAAPQGEGDCLEKLTRISRQGVLSAQVSENLIVLKTLPGLAAGVGSCLDRLRLKALVGTLAGNDTVLLTMKDRQSAWNLYQEIQTLLFHF